MTQDISSSKSIYHDMCVCACRVRSHAHMNLYNEGGGGGGGGRYVLYTVSVLIKTEGPFVKG